MGVRDPRQTARTDLMAVVFSAAQSIGKGFRHAEDDWRPMLFFRTSPDGPVTIAAVPLIAENKALTAVMIEHLLKSVNAIEAVWLTSAWMVTRPLGILNADTNWPSLQPDRREILMLAHAGPDFVVARSADINRRPGKPPTIDQLGETWADGLELDGLFVEALRRGLG
ncbi:hypothetical protein B7435_17005 [Mycolicibacterium peregrinum]|uniref:hypothetical protein n=1 Tax=Mycolicibacterium peregrinum TaxID=43304 RepID=UPI000B4BBD02|nr:hypothetical protein [Mycolicibacterium peregrinum]OWM01260.1 hypothetical protein B7435_17005 [Mycolicibacterium peregrinum]